MKSNDCIDTMPGSAWSPWAAVIASLVRTRHVASERLVALFDRAEEWQRLARGRRELQQLTDRELKDIGLSRADVEREASKPFWHRSDVKSIS